jgi:hypothetical protein
MLLEQAASKQWWLDAYLVAAGIDQIAEDYLHDSPCPLDDAASLLAGPVLPAGSPPRVRWRRIGSQRGARASGAPSNGSSGSPLEIADAICDAAALSVPPTERMRLPTWDAVVDKTLALYEAAVLRRPRPIGAPTDGTGAPRALLRARGWT